MDHGELGALLLYAQASGAREVCFVRGLTDEVARLFAARKLRVRPIGPPEQMALFGAGDGRPFTSR